MALTLPVEELTRLQVIFKLSFPDDLLTFEMLSNLDSPNISAPTSLSGYKLHLKGSREGSGLCLRVWAHYDGPNPQASTSYAISEGDRFADLQKWICNADNPTADEHPELLSPESTDASSVADTPLELEGDINASINPPVDVYAKPVADPLWYEIQEQDGPTILPDAFGCTDPSGSFVGNDWLKGNTRAS